MTVLLRLVLALALFQCSPLGLAATTYYCDPAHGNLSNDGKSQEHAWPALRPTVDAGYLGRLTAGDSITCLPGYHGQQIVIRGYLWPNYVTIRGDGQFTSLIANVTVQHCSHLAFDTLAFTPSAKGSNPPPEGNGIVALKSDSAGSSDHIRIAHCRVYHQATTSSWTDTDWRDKASEGIKIVAGRQVTIDRCDVFNVFDAIQWSGDDSVVTRNRIRYFCGDAIKGGGDRCVISDNVIADAIEAAGGYHKDAIQFFYGSSPNYPTLHGGIVRRNLVLYFLDPANKYRASLQGITTFSNPLDGFTFENNLVFADNYHGISLYTSVTNSKVWNNTCYGFDLGSGGGIWVKTGDGSSGTIVRNNLACGFQIGNGARADHNLTIADRNDARRYFVDPDHLGYRTKPGSPVIDAGNDVGPPDDFEQKMRPGGAHWDIGGLEQ